jgi:ABC-type transport system involved in multi-copper enzyme maturation permease subunit
VKAVTHTEVYRPFEGELRRRPLRALTIAWSGMRVAFKSKRALALLYAIPLLSAIISSFVVHLKFLVQDEASRGGIGVPAAAAARLSGLLGEVSSIIVQYVVRVSFFALLAIAWYGAGLIAEDRRLGAHLLYFSRPVTRLDYVLGKLLTTLFFGACAVLFPALAICSTAAFSSPEWSFVLQEGDTIWKTVLFCLLWIGTVSLLVLALSSLVERKGLALALVFGVVFLSHSAAQVLWQITGDADLRVLSLLLDFQRVAEWMFDLPSRNSAGVGGAATVIGITAVGSALVLWRRVRRMEVVA